MKKLFSLFAAAALVLPAVTGCGEAPKKAAEGAKKAATDAGKKAGEAVKEGAAKAGEAAKAGDTPRPARLSRKVPPRLVRL